MLIGINVSKKINLNNSTMYIFLTIWKKKSINSMDGFRSTKEPLLINNGHIFITRVMSYDKPLR